MNLTYNLLKNIYIYIDFDINSIKNVNDIDNINDMIFDKDSVNIVIMMNFILFDVWGVEKILININIILYNILFT